MSPYAASPKALARLPEQSDETSFDLVIGGDFFFRPVALFAINFN